MTRALSECLREAGADLVEKNSQGALRKTPLSLSRSSLGNRLSSKGGPLPPLVGQESPSGEGPSSSFSAELLSLRAELEQKARSLRAVQRNYEIVCADVTSARDELDQLQRSHDRSKHDFLSLEKITEKLVQENAQLSVTLSSVRGERAAEAAASAAALTHAETLAAAAERQVAEWQAAFYRAKSTSQDELTSLQDLRLKEMATAKVVEQQLAGALHGGSRISRDLGQAQSLVVSKERLLVEAEAKIARLEASLEASRKVDDQLEIAQLRHQELESELVQAHAEIARIQTNIEAFGDVGDQLSTARLRHQELKSELDALRVQPVGPQPETDGAEVRSLREQVERAVFVRDAAVQRAEEARVWAQEAHEKEQLVWRENAEQLAAQCTDLRASLANEATVREVAQTEVRSLQMAAEEQNFKVVLKQQQQQQQQCEAEVQTALKSIDGPVGTATGDCQSSETAPGTDAAKLGLELAAVRTELAAALQTANEQRDESQRWSDKAMKLEVDQGTVCSRLGRAEANLELLRSELEEARACARSLPQ